MSDIIIINIFEKNIRENKKNIYLISKLLNDWKILNNTDSLNNLFDFKIAFYLRMINNENSLSMIFN